MKDQESLRDKKSRERKAAILAAAKEEFIKHGFVTTKMEDVATRANVAKGTIYLHYRSKKVLFEAMVLNEVSPFVSKVLKEQEESRLRGRAAIESMCEALVSSATRTRISDVIRLLISEGLRDPKMVAFHYQKVVSPMLKKLGEHMRVAQEEGAVIDERVFQMPQLLVAPALFGIIWNRLFGSNQKLDVGEMLNLHINSLFGSGGSREAG